MRKKSFIILNLLATIIEVSLILWLIISVMLDNPVLGIISLVVYLVFVVTMIRISVYNKTIFNIIDFPEALENSISKIVTNFKQYYPDREVSIYYVKDDSFIEPAAYLDNKIYVNGNYKFSDIFFGGIIAHELGHAQSELVKYKWINLLRLSSIFARQIFAFRYKKRKWFRPKTMKILDIVLLFFYNILNIFDHLVSNPFFRADEIYANEIAIKIGYGDSLRCFYYNSFIGTPKEINYISKNYDYKHPSVSRMLQLMESKMDLDDAEKDIYSVNNKIFKINNTSGEKERNQKIMNWYHFKAKQNIDFILNELGMIYLKGKYRNKVDKQKASEYFNKAKTLNYLPSIYQLALLKYDDNLSDKTIMFNEFKVLSDSKYEKAYIYLAYCYGYGSGTEIDNNLAYDWFEKAAENKNQAAINYLKLVHSTFLFESSSNKNIAVVKDRFIFNSVKEVIRVDATGNNHSYSMIFRKNKIYLLDDQNLEFTRFIFSKNKLIRENVITRDEQDKTYITQITYQKENIIGANI